ncbi:hypothetical protein CVD25_05955 [Bacillus canaveralius]|uniref:Uncharacterized protein n=1 Tax=Bacillus canaveralius TaxID=1403243 RepID=A0A2N5GKI9_9BACI|nr:hypothetical protein [Bacillus canaveralius]PLR82022.1 hypothetical protein CU635_12660 [Bacillus canaveralius]PLR99408.1 hypothetical protein CVD25_05955 [Bacillus canaveralius]
MIDLLPQFNNFPNSAPRYPNLWIMISDKLADNYKQALTFVVRALEDTIEMEDDYGYFHTAEGCDAVGRRRGLQLIKLGDNGYLTHDHSIHLRFYTHYLSQQKPFYIEDVNYYPVAASVHFEVDRPAHLHPFVDECPICGCTGEYEKYYQEDYHNESSKLKNEFLHDPFGVEAIIYGTVKNKPVPLLNGLQTITDDYEMMCQIVKHENLREDMNTGTLGIVRFVGRKQ